MSYQFCERCGVHYIPGCGEQEWHSRCPHPCAICRRPLILGREPEKGDCQGHTTGESNRFMREVRDRPRA